MPRDRGRGLDHAARRGPMEPIILVIIAVVIIAVVVFVRRKSTIALPPDTDAAPKAALQKPAEQPKPVAKAQGQAKSSVSTTATATAAVKDTAAPIASDPGTATQKASELAVDTKSDLTPSVEAARVNETVAAVAPVETSSELPAALSASIPSQADVADITGVHRTGDEGAASLRQRLVASRDGFFGRLKDLFTRKPALDDAALDELEEILLSSDVGAKTTGALLETLRARHAAGTISSGDMLHAALKSEVSRILAAGGGGAIEIKTTPTVLLFVGVNGVGKTTTIGKLASKFKESGARVLLAAGDTYRAAAVIQLEAWSRRVGCDVVKGKERSDPSGVVFDAVKKAIDERYDVVLCDTAGRLQTKMPLMDELAKLGRSVEKALGRPADETLLVLDATTGQNAIAQATQFGATLPLTGIVLTKMDGSAKGGVILGIVDEQKVPVRYVGIGERVEDLRVFEPKTFVEALLDGGDEA